MKARVPAVPLEPVPEVAALVLAAGLLPPVELHAPGLVAHGSLGPEGVLAAPGELLPPGTLVTVVVPG